MWRNIRKIVAICIVSLLSLTIGLAGCSKQFTI